MKKNGPIPAQFIISSLSILQVNSCQLYVFYVKCVIMVMSDAVSFLSRHTNMWFLTDLVSPSFGDTQPKVQNKLFLKRNPLGVIF